MATLNQHALWMLAVGLAGGIWWWSQQPPAALRPDDGVLVAQQPVQEAVLETAAIPHGGYTLLPLAQFEVRARLLSVAWYRGGREAQLAPLDFALGWGPMSDNRLLDQLRFDHSRRFFLWRWPAQPPADPDLITRSAANVHLIPANPAILSQLRRLGPGRIVRLRGLLVEARSADGWLWRSSLSRSDSGAGACELLLVQDVDAELPR